MKQLALKITGTISLAVALLLTTGTLAQANTIAYDVSNPISSSLTDWTNNAFAFTQFNPSLGTLTSVLLSFDGGYSTTLTVTNLNAPPSSGTANTHIIFYVNDAGLNFASGGKIFDMMSSDFSYSLGTGDSTTSGLMSDQSDGNNYDPYSHSYTSSIVLSEFTGTGDILLDAHTWTRSVLSNGGGNSSASQVTDAFLDGSVTYTYTPAPVPEPSNLLLFGLGGLALLGYRRVTR
ncbi:MAG: choice-of-anchor E domain-containing protein [Verrucomicrobiota bacterium]|jgi:hypothetical protein